jgi:ABC-2 type transport system ATP-binding protein
MNPLENRPANPPDVVAVMRGVRMLFFEPDVVRALTDVSFEVRRGEVFGLLGPGGSGKSTTLKLLAGRLRPAEGKVAVFGRSPRHRAIKSRLGYLPEPAGPEGPGNASGILALLGRLFGKSPRRITLAEVLVRNPDLVILDEPFSGLDAAGCRELKELIRTLVRRGKTVILSSNLVSDAREVCDRLAIYCEGRIQATGTLNELLARPDAVCFLAPVLSPATAGRVLQLIRDEVGGGAMAAETAPEIPGKALPAGAAADKTLAPLTKAAGPVAPPEPLHPTTDPVDHEKLAELTKPAPGISPANPEKTVEPQNDATRANEKLSGLLG